MAASLLGRVPLLPGGGTDRVGADGEKRCRVKHNVVMTLAFPVLVTAAVADVAWGEEPLASWNEGSARKAIVDFVARVTKEGSSDFARDREGGRQPWRAGPRRGRPAGAGRRHGPASGRRVRERDTRIEIQGGGNE